MMIVIILQIDYNINNIEKKIKAVHKKRFRKAPQNLNALRVHCQDRFNCDRFSCFFFRVFSWEGFWSVYSAILELFWKSKSPKRASKRVFLFGMRF